MYPRKSVSIIIILGYACNVAYAFLLYKFIEKSGECDYILPKFERIFDKFDQLSICQANQLTLNGLKYLFIIWFSTIFLCFLFNFKHIRKINDIKFTSDEIKVILISLIFFGIFLYIYVSDDLTYSGRNNGIQTYIGIYSYAVDQMRWLHLLIGLYAFFYNVFILDRLFTHTKLER
jgi:hypothetical protein